MKKILLILLLCTGINAGATVWYISTTGNDATGSGTIAAPWRTLVKATTTVTTPGDIIHVYPGTYLEATRCNLAAGVSLKGDGPTSIIQGNFNTAFTEILWLESATEGTAGNQTIHDLTFDGRSQTTDWGVRINARTNVEVYNCTFKDFQSQGLMVWGRTDANFQAAPTVYATGNKVHDCIFTNTSAADFIYGRGALHVAGQDGMLIYNNTMTQNTRPAGQDGYLIKMVDFNNGVKIYNNTITKSPYPYATPSYATNYWDFAIEIGDIEGGEIYNNTIQGSIDANRIVKGAYPYGLYIHGNTIGFNSLPTYEQFGCVLEYGVEDAIIDSNTFKNVGQVVMFTPRENSIISNCRFTRNLCYSLGRVGGWPEGIIQMQTGGGVNWYTLSDFKVQNNTFICATGGNGMGYGLSISNSQSITNLRYENNVLQGISGNTIIANTATPINTVNERNNCYFNNASNSPLWLSGSPTNYTSSGNITSNPNLNGSYQPTGAPLVDAGIITGLPYNGAAPDIGFFETGGAPGNLPPTANAGTNQALPAGTTSATLTGSGSDADGTVTGYSWVKLSGPSCTITTPENAATSVTGLTAGTYIFQLTTTDNNGATGTDTVTITVAAAGGAVEIKYYRKLNF